MMADSDSYARRILVVEDEPTIGALVRQVLSGEGFDVDIATNGNEAQQMVQQTEYGLLLLDIRMPVLDGKEFYLWLRDNHPESIDRVVFMTGSVMSDDTRGFIEGTGRPLLSKPFTPDDLRSIIRDTGKGQNKGE